MKIEKIGGDKWSPWGHQMIRLFDGKYDFYILLLGLGWLRKIRTMKVTGHRNQMI